MLRRGVWACGEILVTVGVVLLLLVVHQLWWTNRQAKGIAARGVERLEEGWRTAGAGEPGVREPGVGADEGAGVAGVPRAGSGGISGTRASPRHAYAILSIPRLGLRVPVAEGVGKEGVLDKGYVGHYPSSQQPGQAGNFALAGHRNTHGEPFRYVDRLTRGDEIGVETADAFYTYVVDKGLRETSPRDDGVVRPVPRSLVHPDAGYREPGYYLTLTTCTPEYSSAHRLIVWAKLSSMRPR
ncbi:class E sortase [Streptomyces sp. NPDC088387]|uniref:class E sortase n=1 Tax=Streptomyces sp. NPDC088387 TaxID=3365859 RepID=UPI003817CF11